MKYRKRPVVIEAERFFSWKLPWPDGVEPAKLQHNRRGDRNYWPEGAPVIQTLEGPHYVSDGDWIITEVQGEKYPCKPDIFEAIYEPANRPSLPSDSEFEGELGEALNELVRAAKHYATVGDANRNAAECALASAENVLISLFAAEREWSKELEANILEMAQLVNHQGPTRENFHALAARIRERRGESDAD